MAIYTGMWTRRRHSFCTGEPLNMESTGSNILIVNCGSTSIKFGVYDTDDIATPILMAEVAGIGSGAAILTSINLQTKKSATTTLPDTGPDNLRTALANWLKQQVAITSIKAIGHRVVFGMDHTQPEMVTPDLLSELKRAIAYDPDHLPMEIEWIEYFGKLFPSMLQVACFDTAFHTSMPTVAKMLAIPRKYYAKGIKRYGFHGLSYAYLMDELRRTTSADEAQGRIILAHLGGGASIAAVSNGKCIDTSMGFTPASGLVMGTRTGDLDPGVVRYLTQTEKLNPEQFNHVVNQESGLLGISETTGDMQELLRTAGNDYRAAEAVEVFCYHAKKWIGSFAAALGGLDTLVFAGGIGEHAAEVRERICNGMEFLGIELEDIKNSNNEPIISSKTSRVCVRVIKTDEGRLMTKLVIALLAKQTK